MRFTQRTASRTILVVVYVAALTILAGVVAGRWYEGDTSSSDSPTSGSAESTEEGSVAIQAPTQAPTEPPTVPATATATSVPTEPPPPPPPPPAISQSWDIVGSDGIPIRATNGEVEWVINDLEAKTPISNGGRTTLNLQDLPTGENKFGTLRARLPGWVDTQLDFRIEDDHVILVNPHTKEDLQEQDQIPLALESEATIENFWNNPNNWVQHDCNTEECIQRMVLVSEADRDQSIDCLRAELVAPFGTRQAFRADNGYSIVVLQPETHSVTHSVWHCVGDNLDINVMPDCGNLIWAASKEQKERQLEAAEEPIGA